MYGEGLFTFENRRKVNTRKEINLNNFFKKLKINIIKKQGRAFATIVNKVQTTYYIKSPYELICKQDYNK